MQKDIYTLGFHTNTEANKRILVALNFGAGKKKRAIREAKSGPKITRKSREHQERLRSVTDARMAYLRDQKMSESQAHILNRQPSLKLLGV